jgi:hypothetical protein
VVRTRQSSVVEVAYYILMLAVGVVFAIEVEQEYLEEG